MIDDVSHFQEAGLSDTPGSTGEEKTIFCAGFPPDVRYREIRNLFRFLDGFMYCVLNLKGKSPTVFASFINIEFAQTAMELLNGIRFDEECYPHMELRTQVAKSNIKQPGINTCSSRGTDFGHQPPQQIGGEKTMRIRSLGNSDNRNREPLHGNLPPYAMPEYPPMYPSMYPPPGIPSYPPPNFDNPHRPPPAFFNSNRRNTPSSPSEITTAFVANLSITCDERTIGDLFSGEPGFRALKFNPPKSAKSTPVAFVDFIDHASAIQAIQKFNGQVLPEANTGIKVQLAKSNMANERKKTHTDYGFK